MVAVLTSCSTPVPVEDVEFLTQPPLSVTHGATYLYRAEVAPASEVELVAVALPLWASFLDLGDGSAVVVGTPARAHVGDRFEVDIIARDGAGTIRGRQTYDIEVRRSPVIGAAVGSDHAMAHNLAGEVFTWGANERGQLALAEASLVTEPRRVTVLPEGVLAAAVAAGDGFSLLLDARGRVWSWGVNGIGQAGQGTSSAAPASPEMVALPDSVDVGPVSAIAAGNQHALALTSSGRVYAWGANQDGQLGIGFTPAWSAAPVRVPFDLGAGIRITAIAAGTDHSLALTSDGRVFAWGANANAQLGLVADDRTRRTSPTRVPLPAGTIVERIATGAQTSFAITSTGAVYAWGLNTTGQLGIGSTGIAEVATVITRFPADTRIETIASGRYATLYRAASGALYASGQNAGGEFGDGTTNATTFPIVVAAERAWAGVALGDERTVAYAADDEGRVYQWGRFDGLPPRPRPAILTLP